MARGAAASLQGAAKNRMRIAPPISAAGRILALLRAQPFIVDAVEAVGVNVALSSARRECCARASARRAANTSRCN